MRIVEESLLDDLQFALSGFPINLKSSTQLMLLVQRGLDKLPLPAGGETLHRWRALSLVAFHDLSLAKLYEGHTDALATLAEIGEQGTTTPGSVEKTWGLWAAESPSGRVTITRLNDTEVQLDGTKCWCSGAQTLSHGLLTAWHLDGSGPQLVQVAMDQPGVQVFSDAWVAVGMSRSASVDVCFSRAKGQLVGKVGSYLSRPGFWQGAAGVAACWYGGALLLASALHEALAEPPAKSRGDFRLAAFGKVDLALHTAAALIRDAAQWVDDNPLADASEVALRVRLGAEGCAKQVLDEAGRTLGAAAFCRNPRFAQAAADLPVFVRQSHAERDFAALANRVLLNPYQSWSL